MKECIVCLDEHERNSKFCTASCRMRWFNKTHPHIGTVLEKECIFCRKVFLIKNNPKSTQKYCNDKCYWASKVGESHSWGDKISKALKGIPKSPEHIANVIKANTGKTHPSLRGSNHHNWRGDKVGYSSLHDWVRLRLPPPVECKHCCIKNKKIIQKNGINISYLHLANLNGLYKRDLSDWVYLCPKCHSELDRGRNSIEKIFKERNYT